MRPGSSGRGARVPVAAPAAASHRVDRERRDSLCDTSERYPRELASSTARLERSGSLSRAEARWRTAHGGAVSFALARSLLPNVNARPAKAEAGGARPVDGGMLSLDDRGVPTAFQQRSRGAAECSDAPRSWGRAAIARCRLRWNVPAIAPFRCETGNGAQLWRRLADGRSGAGAVVTYGREDVTVSHRE